MDAEKPETEDKGGFETDFDFRLIRIDPLFPLVLRPDSGLNILDNNFDFDLTAAAVAAAKSTMNWHLYIILASDNSLYTGITTDIDRRFRQHAEGRGAKYFRGRQPLKVVYLESGHSRSSAAKREAEIKSLNRADKALLVSRQSTPGSALESLL